MKNKFEVGCQVSWKWMSGIITGKVQDIYIAPITKEIKGKLIKRNGSIEKPAYLVKSEAGNFALKLHTELFTKGEEA